MKAVFLDYSTVGPGLDLSPLTDLLPDLEIFAGTQDKQVLDRIRDRFGRDMIRMGRTLAA